MTNKKAMSQIFRQNKRQKACPQLTKVSLFVNIVAKLGDRALLSPFKLGDHIL